MKGGVGVKKGLKMGRGRHVVHRVGTESAECTIVRLSYDDHGVVRISCRHLAYILSAILSSWGSI